MVAHPSMTSRCHNGRGLRSAGIVPTRKTIAPATQSRPTAVTVGGLKRLPGFLRLRSLNLSYTRAGDEDVKQLTVCGQLRDLGLNGTRVTDAGAKHLLAMKEMRWLGLSETAVGDDGLEAVATLKHLQELNLWKSKVTPEGISRLRKALPGLEVKP